MVLIYIILDLEGERTLKNPEFLAVLCICIFHKAQPHLLYSVFSTINGYDDLYFNHPKHLSLLTIVIVLLFLLGVLNWLCSNTAELHRGWQICNFLQTSVYFKAVTSNRFNCCMKEFLRLLFCFLGYWFKTFYYPSLSWLMTYYQYLHKIWVLVLISGCA